MANILMVRLWLASLENHFNDEEINRTQELARKELQTKYNPKTISFDRKSKTIVLEFADGTSRDLTKG